MKTIMFLCFISLFSCTSPAVKIHHYLLTAPDVALTGQNDASLPVVLVNPVNVAEYLRQPSLVILLDQHELYYSLQDVWAESLQSSFYQALLQDLNNASTHQYVNGLSPLANKASSSISLDLTHFHSTDSSTVVVSGYYWLSYSGSKITNKDELPITKHSFYYERDLQQDGFVHAVNQLRSTVTLLAKQIKQDIAATPNN